MKLSFKLIKADNKLQNGDKFKQEFNNYFKTLEDGEYNIEIKKHEKSRSLNQNNYYFGVIIKELSENFGIDSDSMHNELKYLFLSQRYIGIKGNEFVKILSTKNLKTAQFEQYLEKIRQWASLEHGINLPLPYEDLNFTF